MAIDCAKALKETPGQPVTDFKLRFNWHPNYWQELFDEQINLIRRDIARALADRKLIAYLSCPISARGGGDHNTNVEIARITERRLLARWGERFWILNPAQYQMESEEGKSMMELHAAKLGINLGELQQCFKDKGLHAPSGGDYMRMWTKVLVEDNPMDTDNRPYYDPPVANPSLPNSAQHFDAFYFIGPSDVQEFFAASANVTLSGAIETHFARKYATDPDFRDAFSVDGIAWGTDYRNSQNAQDQKTRRHNWETLRRDYLRFYAVRASVNFSLGSHDEWNIFRLINERRRTQYGANDNRGIAEQLAGYFDGCQIDPAAAECGLSNGYAI